MQIINHHNQPVYFTFYKGDEIDPDNPFANFRVPITKKVDGSRGNLGIRDGIPRRAD